MESIVVRVVEARDDSYTYTIPPYTVPSYTVPSTLATYMRASRTIARVDSTTTPSPTPTHNETSSATMTAGLKSGIALVCFLSTIVLIVLGLWYCCGCCGLRSRLRERRRISRDATNPNPRHLEMADVQERPRQQANDTMAVSSGAMDAPPPQYDEVVPPEHRTLAGGLPQRREEDDGVISDGKTPLSELALEDVVLDHSPSEGSARTFGERHYQAGGDTTGHTNV